MYGRCGESSRRMPAYAPITATIATAASAAAAIQPLSVMTPAPCACMSKPGHRCHVLAQESVLASSLALRQRTQGVDTKANSGQEILTPPHERNVVAGPNKAAD